MTKKEEEVVYVLEYSTKAIELLKPGIKKSKGRVFYYKIPKETHANLLEAWVSFLRYIVADLWHNPPDFIRNENQALEGLKRGEKVNAELPWPVFIIWMCDQVKFAMAQTIQDVLQESNIIIPKDKFKG